MATSPSRSFHLIDAIDTPTSIDIAEKTQGYLRYRHIKLYPHTDYSLDEKEIYGDETAIRSLKEAVYRKPYSKALEDKLKLYNISYEIDYCKACGGRVKKLVYHPVEVIE